MKTLGTIHKIRNAAWKREDGQTLILAGLSMAVLMGVLALAVDVGMMFYAQQTAQTAADAGAIAAMREEAYGDAVTAARADAAANGYTHGQNGVTVLVYNPPQSGSYTTSTDGDYVQVVVTKQNPSFFLRALNIPSMTVSARATAELVGNSDCVYTLSPTGTDINISNGVNVNFPGCQFYANSSSSTAASVVGGGVLNDAGTNLVGGCYQTGGGTINGNGPIYSGATAGECTDPNVHTGSTVANDPLKYLQSEMPSIPSTCSADPVLQHTQGGATYNVSAGCYSNLSIQNNDTVNIASGTYFITGTLNLAGGAVLNGTGVTFILGPSATINTTSGGATLNITAPTTQGSIYNGILFYSLTTQPINFEGGANSQLQGILYFPNAPLTFENGTNTSTYASIIASTLTFAGGANVQRYAIKNPGTPISSPRLVE